ncbi:VanZ family protein [Telluribacter sp. SYSU D00476]|uniref:VanZ family protein n=1 Tax=Telluribacter sp. SYSU D00476 TaxID=2811430 RepID=UPI001FF23977|nr:VanZ family protein [Telluribacter sp. SYSU D00476]
MDLKNHSTIKQQAGPSGNILTGVLFIIYLAALVWILLFKLGVQFSYMDNRSVNLVPFGGSSLSQGRIGWSELILNVVIFVPFGIYAGVLFRRWSFSKKLSLILVTTLLLESLQYIFRIGAFDSTDLVTNTTGGIIGLLFYQLIERLATTRTRAQNLINIIASIGTVVMIVLLVLLKTNSLGIRYQ